MTEFDIILGVLFVVTMIGLAYTHKPPQGGCGCRV